MVEVIGDKYKITHNDKSITTKYWADLSDEECETIRRNYKIKPKFERVKKEIFNIIKGSAKNTQLTRYYYEDLMYDVKKEGNKFTINEALESNDLIRSIYDKIQKKPLLFRPNEGLNRLITKAFAVGSAGLASKIANYPIKSLREILPKYCINNNWYDYSCGWGARASGAAAMGVNYYGTDPNYDLVKKIEEMLDVFSNFKPVFRDIRIQGSETFIPEWENKMGLAFSSPPYFNLEEYCVGDQSIKDRNYDQWLSHYWEETVKNIDKYLIPEGYFLLNIKSFDKYDLEGDMRKIAEENGFIHTHSEQLENQSRPKNSYDILNDEVILVFRKKGYKTNPHLDAVCEFGDDW